MDSLPNHLPRRKGWVWIAGFLLRNAISVLPAGTLLGKGVGLDLVKNVGLDLVKSMGLDSRQRVKMRCYIPM